jgi:hypothetical protein
MRHRLSGQILVGATLLILMLLILIPLLIQWSQDESRWAVKDQQTTTTFNLAEGAVDRGMWKLKSATSTWAAAAAGTVIAGYNLDVVYQDIVGALYPTPVFFGPVDQPGDGFRGRKRFAVGSTEGDSRGLRKSGFPRSASLRGQRELRRDL